MNRRLYEGILIAVTLLGILSVGVLVAYTAILYSDVSIISYIANGR